MNEWDLYFSAIVGWSLHPGYLKDESSRLTLVQAADLADRMMEVRESRCLG